MYKTLASLIFAAATISLWAPPAPGAEPISVDVQQFSATRTGNIANTEDTFMMDAFEDILRAKLAATGGKFEVHDAKGKSRDAQLILTGTAVVVRKTAGAEAVSPPAVRGLELDARLLKPGSGDVVAEYHCSVEPDLRTPAVKTKQGNKAQLWTPRSPAARTQSKLKYADTEEGRIAASAADKLTQGLSNDIEKIQQGLSSRAH